MQRGQGKDPEDHEAMREWRRSGWRERVGPARTTVSVAVAISVAQAERGSGNRTPADARKVGIDLGDVDAV